MSIGTLYVSHSTDAGSAEFNSVPFHNASIDWKSTEASTMSFSSPIELYEADRVRYKSGTHDFGGQIYKKKKSLGDDYQYDVISYLRLYHDKVTVSYKNKTSSQILKKVLKLSKNNFRTSGVKNTEIVHANLKWENTSIWDIACQLAWLEQQAGFIIHLEVDADGTLIFKYADDQQKGYSFSSVFSYDEEYDSSDIITASNVTYQGKVLATASANKDLIAKWGYVTENEECQGTSTGKASGTTETKSTGLRDDAQIQKYKIPNSVVQQALSVAKEGKSDKENLKLIYEWCNHHIGYQRPMYYSSRYHAEGTLKRRKGNCCDNAHVMIAMARSVGIKARYAHAHHGSRGHVWGEYYVNGSWFTVDTGTGSTTQYWGSHSNYAGSKTANYDKLPF